MRVLSFVALAAFILVAGVLQAEESNGKRLIEAELIADSETLVPGRGLTVGVHLKIAEGWHTYWANPGDSGIPVTVDWELPEGVRVGEIQWPLPRRMEEPGDLKVYAYKDEVLLMTRVFVRPGTDLDEVTLKADVDWLVCRESCLPGDARLSLTLPVADDVEPVNTEFFEQYREKLPRQFALGNGGLETKWEREGDTLYLLVRNIPEGAKVDFYPRPESHVLVGHADEVESYDGGGDFSPDRVLSLPLESAPEDLGQLGGVLILEEGPDQDRKGWGL